MVDTTVHTAPSVPYEARFRCMPVTCYFTKAEIDLLDRIRSETFEPVPVLVRRMVVDAAVEWMEISQSLFYEKRKNDAASVE